MVVPLPFLPNPGGTLPRPRAAATKKGGRRHGNRLFNVPGRIKQRPARKNPAKNHTFFAFCTTPTLAKSTFFGGTFSIGFSVCGAGAVSMQTRAAQ